jgi:hypothetical protein
MRLPNGARCGMPLRRFAGMLGGVGGVKLCFLSAFRRAEEEALPSEAAAAARRSQFLAFAASGEQPMTLHPREQKRKLSRRLRAQTSQRLASTSLMHRWMSLCRTEY